jgi:DAK2 domain fusion protein YloV
MAITSLDGAAFEKFVAAGTYFLRKYQGVLNDLNVFPVPDGDTGSNMYLTARAAMQQARRARSASLASVASAAAHGSLIGARGNSGVILSQLLRGFAHTVRDRDAVDTRQVAVALDGAVAAARAALTAPVEGTMITVAQSAADAAHRIAPGESDFLRFGEAVVRAANAAVDRTPEQLPVLKAAGVVDSGAAGLCYFLEGALQFVPEREHATAFPRRPEGPRVFHAAQTVGEYRYCTEFLLNETALDVDTLRARLAPLGDSLIVAGAPPAIKVHLHAADPEAVQRAVRDAGTLERLKIDDMAEQHRVLVVDVPPEPFAIVAVVPGPGFDRIARELGAEVTVPFGESGPSLEELVVAVNATFADRVYLFANDPKVALSARDVAARTRKTVIVVPARDIVAGLAAQLAIGDHEPSDEAVGRALEGVRSAALFRTGVGAAAAIDGRLHTARSLRALLFEVVGLLGGEEGGLVSLYYGGRQRERDARRYASALAERFGVDVDVAHGGQPAVEYWVSVER